MEQQRMTLLLNQLKCIHESGEAGSDDIYLRISVDNGSATTYFYDNPFKMDTGENANIDISIDVTG